MEVIIAAASFGDMKPIRYQIIMHHGMRTLLWMTNYWLIGAYNILYKLNLDHDITQACEVTNCDVT